MICLNKIFLRLQRNLNDKKKEPKKVKKLNQKKISFDGMAKRNIEFLKKKKLKSGKKNVKKITLRAQAESNRY